MSTEKLMWRPLKTARSGISHLWATEWLRGLMMWRSVCGLERHRDSVAKKVGVIRRCANCDRAVAK